MAFYLDDAIFFIFTVRLFTKTKITAHEVMEQIKYHVRFISL